MKFKLLILLLFPMSCLAQFKGLWNGYITMENRDLNSSYILNIKEESDGIVRGDAYLYRVKYLKFLGKMNFIGTIEDGKLNLTELKLLINQRPITNEDFCYKEMLLEMIQKDSITHLTGPWSGALVGGHQCPPGDVFLRRVDEKNSGFEAIPEEIFVKLKEEDKNVVQDSFLNTVFTDPHIINVHSRNVTVEISDYDVKDGDIISVYVNREKVISRLKIKKRPTTQIVKLSPKVHVNELVIFAHNLGEIPPNTCLMKVSDGITTQEIYIASSLQKSALIYFKYTPPK
ncbi:MAG: hypothetical protein ABIP95_11470 [Pelobium sp.]